MVSVVVVMAVVGMMVVVLVMAMMVVAVMMGVVAMVMGVVVFVGAVMMVMVGAVMPSPEQVRESPKLPFVTRVNFVASRFFDGFVEISQKHHGSFRVRRHLRDHRTRNLIIGNSGRHFPQFASDFLGSVNDFLLSDRSVRSGAGVDGRMPNHFD